MKQMAYINVRVDSDVKAQASRLFTSLGLTMTRAVTLYLKAAIDRGAIPFKTSTRLPSRKPRTHAIKKSHPRSEAVQPVKTVPFRNGFDF